MKGKLFKANFLNIGMVLVKKIGESYFFILVLAFLFLPFTSSLTNSTDNYFKESQICLNSSEQIMIEMISAGFSVNRLNDSIKEARSIYDSQLILKEKKKSYDFFKVVSTCESISNLRDEAKMARDSLDSLTKFYYGTISKELNTSSIDVLIEGIKGEIRDERYENVEGLIEKTYTEIANVQAAQSTLSIFYKSTGNQLKRFLFKNFKIILVVILVISILFLIYRVRIMAYLLNKKIERLKLRKDTIKNLIMQCQKNYFQFGTLPEGEYNIKIKKYAELVRDIDRQIPLLQEEMAKLKMSKEKWRLRM
jgi:hypothetical protein